MRARVISKAEAAHRQMAEKLGIPFVYYGTMMQRAPHLLATNVNHWLGTSGKRNLVRTLDHRVRAFLSDRYRRLDNYEVLSAVLPTLFDVGDVIPLPHHCPTTLSNPPGSL